MNAKCRGAVLGLACAAVVAWAEPVEACSPSLCLWGYFYPADGEQIPAHAPALVWRPTGDRDVSSIAPVATLRRDDTQAEQPFTTETTGRAFMLVPGPALAPGTYTFEDPALCHESGAGPFHFTVGPAAPLPTVLGALVAQPMARAEIRVAEAGSCSEPVDAAKVDVAVTVSPEAQPWAALLQYTTIVDGGVWQPSDSLPRELPVGASWVGHGVDRLYTICSPDRTGQIPSGGLTEGRHVVVMQATLPGTDLELSTDPIEVELSCADGAGGCRCAGVGGAAPAALLGGLLLAALGLRRRLPRRADRA